LRAKLAALTRQTNFNGRIDEPTREPESPPRSGSGEMERPDVKALSQRREAASANVALRKAERWPELSATAQFQRNQGYQAAGATTWFLGFQLEMPFWDGGRRRAQVRQAMALEESARHAVEEAKENAAAEVQAALAGWEAARARRRAATAGLDYALKTQKIQAQRFEAGRLSAADLVDAEAELARARSEATTALVSWWLSDDALRLAMGLEPKAYGARGNGMKPERNQIK